VLLLSTAAVAFYVLPPFETIIRDYDIVVSGTMRPIDWIQRRQHCIATIDVTDVIWGDVQAGDTLTIEWSGYWEDAPRQDPQLGERIFLLRRTGATLELETHVMIPASGRGRIEKMLRDLPIRVAPAGDWRDGNWGLVDLVYLNASDEERAFSGVRYEGGRFYAASELTELEFSSGAVKRREWLSRRPGAFVVDPSIPDIVVPPRAEVRVRVDLLTLFEVRIRNAQEYVGFVFFEVDGAGDGHDRMIVWSKRHTVGLLPPN
jgi:hypothetical protein